MKKVVMFLLVVFAAPFVTWGQNARTTSACSLTVTVDSVVVPPCFRVTGGSCGCTNILWAVVNGGTAPYTYSWSPAGGSIAGNADTLNGACYVLWTVKVKDAAGCIDSASLNVVIPSDDTSSTTAGINKYNTNSSSFKLYPVPASNQLNVSLGAPAANDMHIEIYDMLGNKLLTQNITVGATFLPIDVSTYASGNYLLKIIGNSGQKTSKFTVDK